jgi:hypothetical protein
MRNRLLRIATALAVVATGILALPTPAHAAITCTYYVTVWDVPAQPPWTDYTYATASSPSGPSTCRVRILMGYTHQTRGSNLWQSNYGYYDFGGYDASGDENGRAGADVDVYSYTGYILKRDYTVFYIMNGNTIMGSCRYSYGNTTVASPCTKSG